MNFLLAEYTVHNCPSLADEGRAMLAVLKDSFEKAGYNVLTPDENADFGDEIKRLGPLCENGLVIAPDALLAGFTKKLEDCCRNIGCNSFSIAVCANKKRTAEILRQHNIDVPDEVFTGKKVVKPIKGCGTVDVRYTGDDPSAGEFSQEYIEGENLSVSLVGSRVVGETCLYYTGDGPLILALNKQNVTLDENGFHYLGGMTPFSHPKQDEIFKIAGKVVEYLGCQGYVGIDFIVTKDRIVVVDVNPRPTTSIIGITGTIMENIAVVLLDASYGKAPAVVVHTGIATFDAHGEVKYDRN